MLGFSKLLIFAVVVLLAERLGFFSTFSTEKSRFQKSRPRKKKGDLNMMDILDGFQKLVSTQRTFSISISIGLDCQDPHA